MILFCLARHFQKALQFIHAECKPITKCKHKGARATIKAWSGEGDSQRRTPEDCSDGVVAVLLLTLDLILIVEAVVDLFSLGLTILLPLQLLRGGAGGLGLGDRLRDEASIGRVSILRGSTLLAATGTRGVGLVGTALAGGGLAGGGGATLTVGSVALLELFEDLFGPVLIYRDMSVTEFEKQARVSERLAWSYDWSTLEPSYDL